MKSYLLLLATMATLATCRPKGSLSSSLEGYSLLELLPQTKSQVSWLRTMESAETPGVDFYSHPTDVKEPINLAVHSSVLELLSSLLEERNISFAVTSDDLQQLIDTQMDAVYEQQLINEGDDLVFRDPSISYYDLNNYNRLSTIERRLQEHNRHHLVTVQSLAKTYENRDINMVRISTNSGNKAAIIMDCGIHAREWISPAFCMHVIDKLVNEGEQGLLRHFDFVIVPVANPDGYEYTWNGNRMWRKNRRPKGTQSATSSSSQSSDLGVEVEVGLAQSRQFWPSVPGWPGSTPGAQDKCVGADPNRNFDIGFATVGSSSSWCSDTFHGEHAFSEIESLTLRRLLASTRSHQRIAAYLSVHAYSQFWMSPFGYKKSGSVDANDHLRVSRAATQALSALYGTQYKIGPINKVIYQAAGSSVDWAYEKEGIKYSFALELRDKGRNGFLLPVNQIQPTNDETWAGLNAMAWAIAKEFPVL